MGALVLSNMQKELLKLYSTEIPDAQLQEIKYLLSNLNLLFTPWAS